MNDEKFFHGVDEALGHWLDRLPLSFGGKPGEAVPAVDLENVKSLWRIGTNVDTTDPGMVVVVGYYAMKQACQPNADMKAVWYRANFVWLMTLMAPEELAPFMQEGQPNDGVFSAAAKVPAEWMGVGLVRQGPPFDVNEFLRLCGE